ncbi:Frag1/DRAM/Sfk1 family-domain-containing protein [Dipodascopsis uninucleata]
MSLYSKVLERFNYYWLLPLASVLIWWGMLIALMAVWAGNNYKLFPSQDAGTHVPYISDIGASGVKPVFIACAATQGALFVLALMSERYLRHAGRLEPNRYLAEKILSGLAILFAIAGQIGLTLLTILDTYRHHRAHVINLGIFIVGIGISAVCTFGEYYMLRKRYYEVNWLRFSYKLKLLWLIVAIAFAIAFACLNVDDVGNKAAIIEWTLAYWYGFYCILLMLDLRPASKKSQSIEKSGGYGLNFSELHHHNHGAHDEMTLAGSDPEKTNANRSPDHHTAGPSQPQIPEHQYLPERIQQYGHNNPTGAF